MRFFAYAQNDSDNAASEFPNLLKENMGGVISMVRVLFLEDEPTIQEVLAEYMKMQGYDVDLASDGDEAIGLLGKNRYDIAVLDIMVPKVSGLDVLGYIQEGYPQMATIMLTALGDDQMQVKAFNLYADDYVVKPVSPIILLKRMETILRRTQRVAAPEVTVRGIKVCKESYQVFCDGDEVKLTLSEFLLIQTLYERPNMVFTREQLILHIFNEDYIGNDRIIDAHVKNIRKKMPQNYIKTVIGIGYQFMDSRE